MKMPITLRSSALAPLCAALLLGTAALSLAGTRIETAPKDAPPEEHHLDLSGEFTFSDTYVAGARVQRDSRSSSFDENDSLVHLVLTPKVPFGLLRLGVEWDRYSFGLSRHSPLPNTLQGLNLILGLDASLSDSILIRIEAQPGFYGSSFDHLTSRDFNIPFVVGGTYIVNPDLQFVLGVEVDLNRKYPVIPGGGIRWKFAPHFVLNAVLPTPRLEYEYSHSLTLYAGAEVKDQTFRVGEKFGDTHHNPRLNSAVITYSEIRTGVGFNQKVSPQLTLNGEVGCQPFREFDFYRADARYRTDNTAVYGKLSLEASF